MRYTAYTVGSKLDTKIEHLMDIIRTTDNKYILNACTRKKVTDVNRQNQYVYMRSVTYIIKYIPAVVNKCFYQLQIS